MKRFRAYSVIVLTYTFGGGSLLLFGAFLILGSFGVIRFDMTEAHRLAWDAFLCIVFFIQHSGMVRPAFRSWSSSFLPRPYHPAVYSIASGMALSALILLWQESPIVLLQLQGAVRVLPWACFLLSVGGFISGVRALGTFDPFGLEPIALHLRNRQPSSPQDLVVRGPYLWVRHPLYLFVAVLFWSVPELHLDRLLFNMLWTFWIVLGSCFEERDLVAEFGDSYRHYQKSVPMLLPWKGPGGRKM